MSSLVLDSFPTAEISPPSTVQINTSPSYHGKRRLGQPLLGAQPQRSSSYIVPMIDSSPRVKKLLELPENDTSPVKPLKGYTEILKDEQEKTETPVVSKKVYNKEFKEDTKDFLRTPNYNCNDRYFLSQLKVSTSVKNTANFQQQQDYNHENPYKNDQVSRLLDDLSDQENVAGQEPINNEGTELDEMEGCNL